MENRRDYIKYLEYIRDIISSDEWEDVCICDTVVSTKKEVEELKLKVSANEIQTFISKRVPTIKYFHYDSNRSYTSDHELYSWPQGDRKPRVKWLNNQIRKLKYLTF